MQSLSKKLITGLMLLLFASGHVIAQKMDISDVRSAKLRNTGEILENSEVKGYYIFYESDKIDKKTIEYTIAITDENLNKVKDIVFEDDKNVSLLESSYNGSSIMFLFFNKKDKSLEYRAYGFDGKIKSTYSKELDKKTQALMNEVYGAKTDDGDNSALYDIPNVGYTTVYPVKEKKYYSFEVNTFFTDRKKTWTYEAAEEQEDKYTHASFLGQTDSILVYEVIKQKKLMFGNPKSWLLGLNTYTGKKMFEFSTEEESDYTFLPMNMVNGKNPGEVILMGTYFNKGAKVMKDASLGLGTWTINSKGNILSKKYNSWESHISKYLPSSKKGKVDDIGFIMFHKIIATNDGKYFAIGEGYQKVANAAGIAGNVALAALGGGRSGGFSNTKIRVTDLVMLEFNPEFEVVNANVYEKFRNSMSLPANADFTSPHLMALMVKAFGGFDYNYTRTNGDKSMFVTAYSDYEKTSDYKGVTFNTISYADSKITTDKLNLKTNASYIRVFPAKTGFVMISEYFKKDKRLSQRLEKMN